MRFEHQLLERLGRIVAAGRIALEQLLGGEQHLVGGFATAALAAHAVGQHGERATGDPVMGQDLDLVLLVGPVTAVDAGDGRQAETQARGAHGRKL